MLTLLFQWIDDLHDPSYGQDTMRNERRCLLMPERNLPQRSLQLRSGEMLRPGIPHIHNRCQCSMQRQGRIPCCSKW
jgi:hypothetical protein